VIIENSKYKQEYRALEDKLTKLSEEKKEIKNQQLNNQELRVTKSLP
jgi:hypothetical protein